MSRTSGVLAAMKAAPGRGTMAPQSGGWGNINSVAANAMYGNPYQGSGYGPFLPRPSRTFSDGAFGPMSPIQPVPVDQPAVPGGFPDPRLWQYPVSFNLPTQPGAEGLKLASFAQLKTIAERYSVARRCIELRKEEIAGLEWRIEMTTHAAKAYQNDHKAMRDFGERAAKATRFFKHPDPDYIDFASFLKALLEEILVFDALSLIFRPKYGRGLGRGVLGSDLDSLSLISGATVRPLLNMLGGKPRPPAPAYQQYLYGVPRSDFQTVIAGTDIDDYGLTGAEVNAFRADTMLYLPLVPRRETPYGFPPVEQALLPIISGLQKQEYQLGWYQEGTVPACYISPGDPNMTPTQVRELQEALNGIAGDPMYHLKVIVLPPGSKVEPQRPVDLADTFDTLVQTQVCMSLDVMPDELGLLPNVGSAGAGGASNASALRFASGESRSPQSRKSTKPLLMTLCGIANYVLQDICGQDDMQFAFEGLVAEEDKQALVERGIQGIQNGLYSIDEVRGWLDLPPWGLPETSEPVVFTAQGPVPFSMAPELIRAAITGNTPPPSGQGTNSGQRSPSSRSTTSQPSMRRGGAVKPNGSHPAPVAPHREAPLTPGHSAAAGAIQSPTPRTGGTTSRSSVAGSRKKAVASELDALKRHLRKGRLISTWVPVNIGDRVLGMIAEDVARGVLLDVAVERAGDICLKTAERDPVPLSRTSVSTDDSVERDAAAQAHWPGWERDLGLVGAYRNLIGQAFHDAEARGSALRKKAATGGMFVSSGVLRDLISDEVRDVFSSVLTPLWTEAWHLGYASAKSLVTGEPADFTVKHDGGALDGFLGTEGEHWLQQVARTGLGNNSARSEAIAWSEVSRAISTAAIQCYRDLGVTHKHLLLSPNACDLCKDAAEDGDIPLDAPFSAGGVTGQVHIRCRCAPGPAGVDAEPPLADLGKASGYTLNPRSGMISLDLPEGTITPVPGGVSDHHITVVYLGPDVDDAAFVQACQRAAAAAAAMPGPLLAAISGIGTFSPSDSSDGKVPAWAGVMLPGAESLREALEDLSASEHKDWKPHVTLAYVEPGEALPAPLPATPVTFTHLSVHRGHDEVARFPFGPAGEEEFSAAFPCMTTVKDNGFTITRGKLGGEENKPLTFEDESRAGFLMLRARHPVDGKWRYLLQRRDDSTWGLPGGSTHLGEDPHSAAVRESTEEIGHLPPLGQPQAVMQYPLDDGKTAWIHLHEVPWFTPDLASATTPEETAGAAWFRRREIGDLDLHPPFRRQWESADWRHIGKSLQRAVNENGEVLTLTPASQRLQATGARWPYPHRADGAENPEGASGDVPGGTAGEMGAAEPPNQINDFAEPVPHDTLEPRGGDDGEMPTRGRKPNPPADAFPDQGSEHDDAWPEPQNTLTPGVLSAGARTGVPPSGEKSANDSGHPVVGSVPAKTPKPYAPHAVEPEAYDPAEAVEDWSPEAGSNVTHGKGAQHVTDANPVEWRHVYAQLEGNFPADSISWVKRARWLGPVNVMWSRIDDDDIDKWAASHQPDAVNRFARAIASGTGHTNPSILVQEPGSNRALIVDGHHRAMARRKLGRPVLAYVGNIDPRDREAAEQTHSSQVHSGTDPGNKSAQTPVVSTVHHPLGTEGLWHTPSKKVPQLQQLPAYVQNTARALMRDQDMDESQAIATAINAIRSWAAGTAFGGHVHVTPEVQQAALRALREWEQLRASHDG